MWFFLYIWGKIKKTPPPIKNEAPNFKIHLSGTIDFSKYAIDAYTKKDDEKTKERINEVSNNFIRKMEQEIGHQVLTLIPPTIKERGLFTDVEINILIVNNAETGN